MPRNSRACPRRGLHRNFPFEQGAGRDESHSRIYDFDSLAKYPPTDHPAGQVADIFNALLDEVKKEYPDDPIVAVITPDERSMSGGSVMDAGSLTAAAQQLLGAVPSPND